MRNILVAGAGKSSIYLIHYLLTHASRNKWKINVADTDLALIKSKTGNHPASKAIQADLTDDAIRKKLVSEADMVLSLLPPQLHILLAKDCLELGKNLLTASYVSPELKELDAEVKAKGLVFLCEMGLDPGIDHMSASNIITSIRRIAGTITSFKSYCGGLIAPESDDNPWHYKFSWNPRNVLTAGTDGARYLQEGKQVSVPYEELFSNTKKVQIHADTYAWYPNRDSLHYQDLLDLSEADTVMRATLRHPDFTKGWNAVVALGLADVTDMQDRTGQTYYDWMSEKAGHKGSDASIERVINDKFGVPAQKGKIIQMLSWLGVFEKKPLPAGKLSSGDILLGLLTEKWHMKPEDKDMVVIKHEIEYIHRGVHNKTTSTMELKGEDREHSAMAKTVGLPMAMAARMMLTGKVTVPPGVQIPNMPALYKPILTELAHHGIVFRDEVG